MFCHLGPRNSLSWVVFCKAWQPFPLVFWSMCRTWCLFWDSHTFSGIIPKYIYLIVREVLIYVFRALEGLACAVAWSSMYSIMMKLYPYKVATIMSSTEMLFGFGYALGPVIGGSLYDLGGFKFPFIALGLIFLANAVAQTYYIPGLS